MALNLENLERLGRLKEAGVLSEEEFAQAKAKLLAADDDTSSDKSNNGGVAANSGADPTGIVSALAGALQSQKLSKQNSEDHTEYEVGAFQSSTWCWLVGSVSGWWAIFLVIAPLLLAANVSDEWVRNACFLVSFGSALSIVVRFVGYKMKRYELSTQRLIIYSGIIFKSIDEIELYRVKDSRVEFSLLNQMVGAGHIYLESSDKTLAGVMEFIPEARAVRETIRELVATERRLKRVRELDGWVE